MPIRGSPNGARHPHPQAGRDRSEWVVAINRNAWSRSIGIAGRDHPVRAAGTTPGVERTTPLVSAARRGLRRTIAGSELIGRRTGISSLVFRGTPTSRPANPCRPAW
jgi:hypothetical protein